MTVRIVTLSENTAQYGTLGEWGLSILVETENRKVLLDAGMGMSAAHNAGILGIDLASIDTIVLSHAHVDHTGGLLEVLKQAKKQMQIVAHPDIWVPKYVVFGEMQRYMGIPSTREELENLGAVFHLTKKPFKISDNIMTTGEIEMTTDFEAIDERLFVKKGRKMIPDPLADDLALTVKTQEGLILITGCAHRGIVNTVRHVQKLTRNEHIHTIIGGTHLFMSSQERIEKTVRELKQLGLQRLGVSHCTGFKASAALAGEFGDVFFLNNSGSQITLE